MHAENKLIFLKFSIAVLVLLISVFMSRF